MSSYTYLNFDISLSKADDKVIVRFLNKITYDVHQKILDTMFVVKNGIGSINNVFKILDICFKEMQNSKRINVTMIDDQIEIEINYIGDFDFCFKFKLDKILTSVVDGKDLYIKKLENRINELENSILYTLQINGNYISIDSTINKMIIKVDANESYTYLTKTLELKQNNIFEFTKQLVLSKLKIKEIEVYNNFNIDRHLPFLTNHPNITYK